MTLIKSTFILHINFLLLLLLKISSFYITVMAIILNKSGKCHCFAIGFKYIYDGFSYFKSECGDKGQTIKSTQVECLYSTWILRKLPSIHPSNL